MPTQVVAKKSYSTADNDVFRGWLAQRFLCNHLRPKMPETAIWHH
jgi:hypothetical protein